MKKFRQGCSTCCKVSVYMLCPAFAMLYLFFISVMPFYVLSMLTGIIACVIFSRSCRKEKSIVIAADSSREKAYYLKKTLCIGYIGVTVSFIVMMNISFWRIFFIPSDYYSGYRLGASTAESITIWTKTPKDMPIRLELRKDNETEWIDSAQFVADPEKDFTQVVTLSKLEPATKYQIRMASENRETQWDEGSFKTLLPSDKSGRMRFSLSSCAMKAARWGSDLKVYDKVLEKQPDFLLFLGDLIYTDVPHLLTGIGTSPSVYYAKYMETFSDRFFARFSTRVPTFFMYDDHEIINDYEGRNDTELFQASITKGWKTYVGSSNPGGSPEGKYYYHFETGKVGFFVVDVHYHRNTAQEQLLGEQQMEELLGWLLEIKNTMVFKFLVSPMPWTRNFKIGWRKYPSERKTILDFIQDNQIKGCVFVSGDAHMTGVFELRPTIFEISTSPLAAGGPPINVFSFQDEPIVFKQPEISMGRGKQYSVFEIDTESDDPTVNAKIYSNEDLWLNLTIHFNGDYQLM